MLAKFVQPLVRWIAFRNNVARLSQIDNRLLADMGITRAEIAARVRGGKHAPENSAALQMAGWSDLLDADIRVAAAAEAEFARRGTGQVDDPAPDERPAVVDGDDDGIAGVLIGHTDLGAERQRLVRGRHGGRVHDLTACGAVARQ